MLSPTKNKNPKLPSVFQSKLQYFPHLWRVWTASFLAQSPGEVCYGANLYKFCKKCGGPWTSGLNKIPRLGCPTESSGWPLWTIIQSRPLHTACRVLWLTIIEREICASLNRCKKMKAGPSRQIPHKLVTKLQRVLLLFPIRGGNPCCYYFLQMLIFTEARQKLRVKLRGKKERTHTLCDKLSCDWQNNGKTKCNFVVRP